MHTACKYTLCDSTTLGFCGGNSAPLSLGKCLADGKAKGANLAKYCRPKPNAPPPPPPSLPPP